MVTTSGVSVAEREAAPATGTPSTRRASLRAWWTPGRVVVAAAALLVLVQLAVRIWSLSGRWLYTDDIAVVAQANAIDLFSTEYLFEGRGGHLVLAALLLSGSLARVALFEWWPFAVTIVLMQVLASLAVWRLARVLLGDRPMMLVPLAVYLFVPLSFGSFTWWSAAMQAVPLQAGLAWVVADAVLYLRTRRRRYVVTTPLVLAVTLMFSERAVMAPLLAVGVVALLLHVEGVLTPLREMWRRMRPFWLGVLLVMAAWTWAFLVAVPSEEVGSATVGQITELTGLFLWNLVPGLTGGPWQWTDVPPGTPLADPSYPLVALSVVALVLLVAWTSWRRVGAPVLWLIATAYVVGNAFLVALGRGSAGFGDTLPRTYRYYAAEAVLLAIVVALLILLPTRTRVQAQGQVRALLQQAGDLVGRRVRGNSVGRWAGRLLVPVLTTAFLVSSVVSTVDHVESWSADPAEEYFTTARAELAAAGDSPLLDQSVPEDVLWSLAAPYNSVSVLLRPLEDRPEFASSTDQLRMLDESGRLQPAQVSDVAEVTPGPLTDCGWGVQPGSSSDIRFSGSVFHWVWTLELNYLASSDGFVTVTLGAGQPVRVPVEQGLHTVFVRLSGDGDTLTVASETERLGLCIDSGTLGNIEFA